MAQVTREQVESLLGTIQERYLEKDLISAKMVKNLEVSPGGIKMQIVQGYPAGSYREELAQTVKEVLAELGLPVEVSVSTQIEAHAVQKTLKRQSGIKNIIAIASGKGGVGKSTTAVNLALALKADGASVGILDADIYGPSQPRMLGIKGQPLSDDGKTIRPMENHGIKAMSMGFLITDEDTPMIWRGPMVTQALEQLLNDTQWGELDYLVIDLPPGTGDIQLTLSQKIPVSGAIIVTTPQDIALLDARKGLKMFEKVEVPILGIVENMSMHQCSQCGTIEHIFGEGGGLRMADQYEVTYLGGLPLDRNIREQVDSGNPTVVADPDGAVTKLYLDIARKAAAHLATKNKDYATKFPTIKIQNV
ncbi:iron-sulfur cluster carrier protein ApbC [Thiofilum flexile]|uniref:iron-sulfur cluster carrier protein ApbC n=1 Tax=Thiofilum flexile TaxID=125627 RepID=UPI000377707C|nr:iron-sulfur cluster carrier protein ApbC [Thiofilum flexile]